MLHISIAGYNLIKDQPGDSYFVRALFTRQPDYNDPQQLSFTKVRDLTYDKKKFQHKEYDKSVINICSLHHIIIFSG